MLYRVCISASLQLHIAKSCWKWRTIRSEVNLSAALFQPYFCILSFCCLMHVLTICTSPLCAFLSSLCSLLISSFFSCSCRWNSASLAFICSCNNKGELIIGPLPIFDEWVVNLIYYTSCYELFLVQFSIRYWETFVRENFHELVIFADKSFFPLKFPAIQ